MYLPGTLPLCDPAVAAWAGESGRRYDFAVVRPATAWLDEPAVFILAKREGARDIALYIGQTGSLQSSFGARALCPDVWTRAMALGMTHLHLRFEACSVSVRRAEVRDIVAAQRPALNEELRHEASSAAMAAAEPAMAAWAPPRPLIAAGMDPSPSRPALGDGAMPLQALARRGRPAAGSVRPARPPQARLPRDVVSPPSPGLPRGALRADPAREEEPGFEQPPLLMVAASGPGPVTRKDAEAIGLETRAVVTPERSDARDILEVGLPEAVVEPAPSREIPAMAELDPPAWLVAPEPPLAPGWTVDTSACSSVADALPAVTEAKTVNEPARSLGLLGRLGRLAVDLTSRLWQSGRTSAVMPDDARKAPNSITAETGGTPPTIVEAPSVAAEPIWLTSVTAEPDAEGTAELPMPPPAAADFDETVVVACLEPAPAAHELEEPEQPYSAVAAPTAAAEEPVDTGSTIDEAVVAGPDTQHADVVIAEATAARPPTETGPFAIAEPSAVPTTDDAAAKRALGLDPTAPCVLFAGELSYATGADIMVDALSVVCADDLRVQIVFAGEGPMRAYLHDRAQSAGFAQRCRFLGDVPPARFEAVLAACDFVVIPARGQQSPDLAALALSRGKPVLATHQAGIGAIVHGRNGLITYDNPGSFVWGIRELLGPLYRDLRRHLAEAA